MKYSSAQPGRIFILRLENGEIVHEEIERFAREQSIKAAALEERSEPQNITIELYTTSWYPYCKDARNFFRSRGISFTEYNIEKDQEAARRKNDLDGGRGVPFVVICDQKSADFPPWLMKEL